MRLDKFLHDSARLTRKLARKIIREGRVSLDGIPVKDPALKVTGDSVVHMDGLPLPWPSLRYLMLNKPPGCICATSDPHQRTVIDLLPPELGEGLIIAGRLDMDTTGLVLLSEDGQWVHRVTSPRHGHPKTYHATLAEPLAESAESRFQRGICLKGEKKRTLPAQLSRLSQTEARITLAEGRYHQVKRMFGALENRVTTLHREQIGEIRLDPELAPGEYRDLTRDEIDAFSD